LKYTTYIKWDRTNIYIYTINIHIIKYIEYSYSINLNIFKPFQFIQKLSFNYLYIQTCPLYSNIFKANEYFKYIRVHAAFIYFESTYMNLIFMK